MPLSDYAEKKVNDLLFGAVALSAPANYYVALLTAAPDGSNTVVEADYGSYARQPIANGKVNFSNAANDGNATITNNVEIRFPTNTLNTNTITHVALMDAVTGGNVWAYGALGVSKVYAVGDRPVFEVNSLSFTVD